MMAKIGILAVAFLITLLALVFYPDDPITQMAAVEKGYERLVKEVTCSKDYDDEPFKSKLLILSIILRWVVLSGVFL